jgi:hypothetical protein
MWRAKPAALLFRPVFERRRAPAAVVLDGALEHVGTGALGRRAGDEDH